MITIRDYAAKKGCTVQNVYKLIRKYKTELEGHYNKIGSKTFLDEYAQQFLGAYITPKALIASDSEMMNEINRLRGLLSQADHKATELAQQNSEMAVKLQKMDSERLLLESDVNYLKEKNEALENEAKTLESDVSNMQSEIAVLKQEIEKRDNAGLIARILKKWE